MPSTEKQELTNSDDLFIKRYKAFADIFIHTTSEFAIIAAKGPSTYLPSLGGGVLLVAIAMKLIPVVSLHPSEFIALIIGAIILIGLGSYFRFYQYKTQQLVNEELRKFGIELLGKTEAKAEELVGGVNDRVEL